MWTTLILRVGVRPSLDTSDRRVPPDTPSKTLGTSSPCACCQQRCTPCRVMAAQTTRTHLPTVSESPITQRCLLGRVIATVIDIRQSL